MAMLAGCSQTDNFGVKSAVARVMPSGQMSATRGKRYRASERERQCLARAMFFESNRSSQDGLVAVGSVVMNRLDSGKWGNDICGVVGAKRQFAPGVLSRQMNSKALPDVMAAADSVLQGKRHPKVHKDVMFFHTAGLKFPYKNMHYTVVAGGNSFYEKRSRRRPMRVDPPAEAEVMVASAEPVETRSSARRVRRFAGRRRWRVARSGADANGSRRRAALRLEIQPGGRPGQRGACSARDQAGRKAHDGRKCLRRGAQVASFRIRWRNLERRLPASSARTLRRSFRQRADNASSAS